MLLIKKYQDRTSKKITCHLSVIHNNKVKEIGTMSLSGAISYVFQSNYKQIEIVMVKNAKSLMSNVQDDTRDVINSLKA